MFQVGIHGRGGQGCGHRRRDAVRGGVRRTPSRAGLSQLRFRADRRIAAHERAVRDVVVEHALRVVKAAELAVVVEKAPAPAESLALPNGSPIMSVP